jgi:UDP-glucose 4-epimerase
MKVVVFGATGNVGQATVRALAADPRISTIVGVARRAPVGHPLHHSSADVTYRTADVSSDSFDALAGDLLRGADAVVLLTWQIQPSRDEAAIWRTNVAGTRRVVEAAISHGVPAVIYASSVGTYAPGPKSPRADETWPATGITSSTYSRHKAEVEASLDRIEAANPALRLVRMRTSLVFQRDAASQIHRLFMGSLLPWHLPRWMRLIPSSARLTFQATHADDIADAYVKAVTTPVSGAFNIAAEPPLNPSVLARAVDGRTVPLPMPLVRAAAQISYRLRLQPSEPGWLDVALQTPLMDSTRARTELGWSPTRSSTDALVELLDGIGDGAGTITAPLHPRHVPPA